MSKEHAHAASAGRLSPVRRTGPYDRGMLSPDLTEAVLSKLGLSERPALDRAGLDEIYRAWCRRVPFDNLVKRIHLGGGSPAPIPNGPPDAFFASWLAHGTGGTCWPSAGGLHALLVELGFDARRGSAAMFDNLYGPIHTHGTTLVRVDGVDYWVDSSMLTDVALPLVPHAPTRHDDPVSPVWAEPVDDARITIAVGQRFERRPDGITSAPLGDDRDRVLIEEFGYSDAIVAQLPADDPKDPGSTFS